MGRLTKFEYGSYVPIIDNDETDQKLGKYEDFEQKHNLSQSEIFELMEIFKNLKINIALIKKSQNFVQYNNSRANNDLLTQSEFALIKRYISYETRFKR